MILKSADKMHKIASDYIEECELNDELVLNIERQAKQGKYKYTFQGELDKSIEQKLWRMNYKTHTKRICGKIYTEIYW